MMLRPREGHDQRTLTCTLEVEPEPVSLRWTEDASGNPVGIARFERRTRELRVVSRFEVEQSLMDPAELVLAAHAQTCPFSHGAEEVADLARFIERQQADPDHRVDAWVRTVLAETRGQGTLGFLQDLNAAIRRDFAYLRREEKGIQDAALTLKLRRGSCRDFAVLMSEAVRSLGFAARFVSGYLHVRPEAGGGPSVAEGSTHAWLQVYLPGSGWLDFDPTSGGVGNRDLIRVALARDPDHATPLSGTFMGFPSDFEGMDVSVEVSLLAQGESARPARTAMRDAARNLPAGSGLSARRGVRGR